MKSILDSRFKYTPAASTDLAATFKRIRKQLVEADRKASESKLAKRRIVGA